MPRRKSVKSRRRTKPRRRSKSRRRSPVKKSRRKSKSRRRSKSRRKSPVKKSRRKSKSRRRSKSRRKSPRKKSRRKSKSMKGWAKMLSPKPGPERRKMMKKCGSRCFLRPRNLGYPICTKNTCKQSRKGLLAAVARGKQNHDEYVVSRARRLLKSKKRSSMINNQDLLSDNQIMNRIRGMNGIDDSNIQNAIILWRRIYEFSVGAGAGSRELPEDVGMMDVFARETDRNLRILADAGIIDEMVNKPMRSIVALTGELYVTAMIFKDSREKAESENPFTRVYIDNYYNELARREEAGIEPVEIQLEEMGQVGTETDMTGLACDINGCRNQGGVCICKLLEPPAGRVFGKCVPESCGINTFAG